jgi:hypothetical protein
VIAELDAVILGRRSYDEWAGYWPTNDIESLPRMPSGKLLKRLLATGS